jgi:hypothetical protein
MNEELEARQAYRRRWDRLKLATGIAALAFTVTLAIVVGNRLSDEALSVLVGAVCGVGAAIPTSLIIVAVTRRQDKQERRNYQSPHSAASYPPVIVVAPPGGQNGEYWRALPSSFNSSGVPSQRRFTVVGAPPTDESEYENDGWW